MPLKRSVKVLGTEQKTIARSELARLTFCNSRKLPLAVNDGGVRKEWVGIGWIEDGKPRGDEVLVVDKQSPQHEQLVERRRRRHNDSR